MTFKRRLTVAAFGLSIALTLAWAVAFMAWAYRRQAITPIAPTINHQPPIVNRQSSTINDGPFIASTLDKKHMVYHLPECSYARKIVNHRCEFKSEAEAEAAGYEPCQRCLLPRIASVK